MPQCSVDQLLVFGQCGVATVVVVGVKKTRILRELVHRRADRLPGKSIRIKQDAHFPFDPGDFAQAKVMQLICLQHRRRVLPQDVGVKGVAVR
jgi:hypothetical protein